MLLPEARQWCSDDLDISHSCKENYTHSISYQFLVVEGEAQTLQHGNEDDYVLFVGGDGTKHIGQLSKTLLQRIDI